MEKIGAFAYRRPKLIIAVVLLLNLVALTSFLRFDLDADFLNFFSSGNPRTDEYNRLNEKYHTGETVVVLIEQNDSLLEKQHLQSVLSLQEDIENVNGIRHVQSFLPQEILVGSNVYKVDQHFIAHHSDLLEDFIRNNPLTSQLLSIDENKGSLAITMEPNAPSGEVVKSLQEITKSGTSFDLSLAGNEIIKDTMWRYLIRILLTLPPCAILLVLLVFRSILKNRRLAIIAIIPAGLGALWTLGTIFWSGQELNLLTILSPIFVVVMGAADGLHYVSHFMDNLSLYPDRRKLTVETLRQTGTPMFLTTITTMAGFASLAWSNIAPMRQMGIFVALGIGYAGLLSLFFLPAIFCCIKLPAAPTRSNTPAPVKFIMECSHHKRELIIAFVSVVVIAALFIPRLEVASNQLMFFKEGSETVRTFNKVEDNFGGALPLTGDIVAERGLFTLRDYELAEDVMDEERDLERIPGIKSAISLFDIVASISKKMTGQEDYPKNPALVNDILRRMDEDDIEDWASSDGLRMLIKTDDLDALDISQIDNFVSYHLNIRAISGMPVLFDEMNRMVVQSQIRSLGLALALIFIMLLATIRRLRAALVSLIPIAITITAIMGMISATEFNLNIVTATLCSIAIGVGVDYSIHLIYSIYYFRERGNEGREAVDMALATVSRPILANAFGLAIGLSVFFLSPLKIHQEVAVLMWTAMVVSSMAALLLIPLFYSGEKTPKE